jgi:hypothetical protein
MNPPSSKPPGTAGETQTIDLQDVELLLAEVRAERSERSLPPPLPPEVRASHVPSEPPAPPAPPAGSIAPAAPSGRSTAFYLVALLAFLVVGIGGGLLVAMRLHKPAPAPVVTAPSGNPQAAVITIPTVEVDDDVDGGK